MCQIYFVTEFIEVPFKMWKINVKLWLSLAIGKVKVFKSH